MPSPPRDEIGQRPPLVKWGSLAILQFYHTIVGYRTSGWGFLAPDLTYSFVCAYRPPSISLSSVGSMRSLKWTSRISPAWAMVPSLSQVAFWNLIFTMPVASFFDTTMAGDSSTNSTSGTVSDSGSGFWLVI